MLIWCTWCFFVLFIEGFSSRLWELLYFLPKAVSTHGQVKTRLALQMRNRSSKGEKENILEHARDTIPNL
ncbi:hypothetical protein NC651_034191 [Populus alba x Populus x berolinensis]|nr:hypothetical protein NC651_034191 [Populus alba x Populus x berolinensis]